MAKIISYEDKELTIEVKIKLTGSMLEMENNILDSCNEVGSLATIEGLKKFETDGSPIKLGGIKLTSRLKANKLYRTPYGNVELKRHVYQTSKGGKIYCPLDDKARIIRGSTPRFAQQVSHKYSNMNATSVCRDLEENHHRQIAHCYVQEVSHWVGSIAQAKEEVWEYDTPKLDQAISTIVLSLDGAYILMREEEHKKDKNYREAMVGNISLYDIEGERQHTIYIGEAPEYGKQTFFKRFEAEIIKIKQHYPDAFYLGIADGATNNWTFLEKHTDRQLLDFYHVTEYLGNVSYAAYPAKTDNAKREFWLHERCKSLKHQKGNVEQLITEMESLSDKKSLTKTIREKLAAALTYFTNHRYMMDYATQVSKKQPIGSGVTEAACKTLVKQRLCCSGMRWKHQGAKIILSLRALVQSKGRWLQFWQRLELYGTSSCL